MRDHISLLVARTILPTLVKQMFAPARRDAPIRRALPHADNAQVPAAARGAEDATLMSPTNAIVEPQHYYRELRMAVTIITGADDQIADVSRHSERRHRELPYSELIKLPRLGHLLHHLAPTLSQKQSSRRQRSAPIEHPL
jgi:pimeloyl-ACP methyl ester carboxylesterase